MKLLVFVLIGLMTTVVACGGGDPTSTPARAEPTVAPPVPTATLLPNPTPTVQPAATVTPAPTATLAPAPTTKLVPSIPIATDEARASIDGDWEGATLYRQGDLVTVVHFESSEERILGTLDFPQIGRRGLALSKVSFEPPKVHFELREFGTVFDGELNGDTISGEFVDPDGSGPFDLKRISP